MTFSNDALAKRLKRETVLVWEDITGEEAAGSSFAHGPKDPANHCVTGAGDHNVQILLLDEWGRILDAVAGFRSAEDLIEELDLSRALRRAIEGQKAGSAEEIVRVRHEKEAKEDAEDDSGGVFRELRRMGKTRDHRFCARNPLLAHGKFRTEDLVGRGRSFFGSSTGGVPKEKIGKDQGGELDESLPEEIREILRGEKEKKK
ncbi:MAG: hypothetical protein R3F20_12980 [Planctomycetota bacterium]